MRYALIFLVSMAACATPAHAAPFNASDSAAMALQYLNASQRSDGGFGDAPAAYYADMTPFAVMAIAAAGQDPHSWAKNGTNPADFLLNTTVPALNGSAPPTYYGVVIMALRAAGENPDNVTAGNATRNLTGELAARQNADGSFSGNSWVTDQAWAVLALTSVNGTALRNASSYLVSQQQADGGFGAFCPNETASCPDETSLGIMALIAAGYERNATPVQRALDRLRRFQNMDAGIDPGWGANADSDAWALLALAAANATYAQWGRETISAFTPAAYDAAASSNLTINVTLNASVRYPSDHLRSLQNATGAFSYFKPVQDTGYATMALLGAPFGYPPSFRYDPAIERSAELAFSANQTGNWTLSVPTNMSVLGPTAVSIRLAVPPGSAGVRNNVTITVTARSGTISLDASVHAIAACGNNVCEPEESCSCADCGGCPLPQPSPGGGGGSSGDGGGAAPISEWGAITESSQQRALFIGARARFSAGNETHEILLRRINNTAATLTIFSEPRERNLLINETWRIDVGQNWLDITLDGVSGYVATLGVRLVQKLCPACPLPESCSEGIRRIHRCSERTNYTCVSALEPCDVAQGNRTSATVVPMTQHAEEQVHSESVAQNMTGLAAAQPRPPLALWIVFAAGAGALLLYVRRARARR